MSQFDYPRINFLGKGTIDSATANNGFYVPLVIFDPIQSSALLPPRLYFTPDVFKPGASLDEITNLLPNGVSLKQDQSGYLHDVFYCEISPINTIDIFQQWAVVPLGNFEADKAFIPLYEILKVPHTGEDLLGINPGYWNYYGSMGTSFNWKGKDNVTVTSVATGWDYNTNQEIIYSTICPTTPPDVQPWLGATISNPGVMIDVAPTFAIYTQIFTDILKIEKDGTELLKGRPCKYSLRFLNGAKIVNEQMPDAGSGVFNASISIDELDESCKKTVIDFFEKYGDHKRKLKGLFVHLVIMEIQEDRPTDYNKIGNNSSPAKSTFAGSISPWYEGELRSLVMGRQLIQDASFISEGDVVLPPCLLVNDTWNKIISWDVLNVVPQINTSSVPSQGPTTDMDPVYATYNLGKLTLLLEDEKAAPILEIGEVQINENDYPRAHYLSSAGILRFPYTFSPEQLQKGYLAVYGQNDKGERVRLLHETPYMIASDVAGLYANEGDDPDKGYLSYGYPKEPCTVSIYEKGHPVKAPIPISIQAVEMAASGGSQKSYLLQNAYYQDGDAITFPVKEATNVMFLFLPNHLEGAYGANKLQSIITIMNSFVTLRVLPKHDYGKYLDPNDPQYPVPVTWDVLTTEIFNYFIMLFPLMGLIKPFTKDSYENKSGATMLLSLISDKNWASPGYMPPTRDLSDDQKQLIQKWAEQILHSGAEENTSKKVINLDAIPDSLWAKIKR